jgi:hypothetical protein
MAKTKLITTPEQTLPRTTVTKAAPKPKPAAKRPVTAKFDACPLCGFIFKQPQAKCMSDTACAKRQQANRDAAKDARADARAAVAAKAAAAGE